MRFWRRRGWHRRQRLRSRAGVVRRPQPSASGRKRTRSDDDVYVRVATPAPGRECMRVGDNACARATTSALVRRRVPGGRGVFSQTPQTLAQLVDDVCVRATMFAPVRRRVPRGRGIFSQTPQTSAFGRRHLRPGDDVWILFFKRWHFFVLWQSKQNFSIISF